MRIQTSEADSRSRGGTFQSEYLRGAARRGFGGPAKGGGERKARQSRVRSSESRIRLVNEEPFGRFGARSGLHSRGNGGNSAEGEGIRSEARRKERREGNHVDFVRFSAEERPHGRHKAGDQARMPSGPKGSRESGGGQFFYLRGFSPRGTSCRGLRGEVSFGSVFPRLREIEKGSA